MRKPETVIIYTDGSCNPAANAGGWAAIIFAGDDKIVLKEGESSTSHNRMELTAVIKALEYVKINIGEEKHIIIYSDSQYVCGIPRRKEKLTASGFLTKQEKPVQNTDLLKRLIQYIDFLKIDFVKVKAHQKATGVENFNREVDKLSRKMVRAFIN